MRVSKSQLYSEAAYDLGSGAQGQLNKEDTGDVLVDRWGDVGVTPLCNDLHCLLIYSYQFKGLQRVICPEEKLVTVSLSDSLWYPELVRMLLEISDRRWDSVPQFLRSGLASIRVLIWAPVVWMSSEKRQLCDKSLQKEEPREVTGRIGWPGLLSDRHCSCLSNVTTFPSYKQNQNVICGHSALSFKDHSLVSLAINDYVIQL